MKENEKSCPPECRIDGRVPYNDNAVPGINTPGIELPAFNPPVPNRAWTAMKKDIEKEINEKRAERNKDIGKI